MSNDTANKTTNKTKQNQLFKTEVPLHILWDFLQNNFEDKDTYFIINKFLYKKAASNMTTFSYKKADYNKNLTAFTESLKEYYNKSKRKYVERTMNYNYFLTIIRQLCNAHNITFTSKLIYDKSTYEIEYSVEKPVFKSFIS